MPDRATPHKLPERAQFLDLSDYARPLAVAIATWLRGTPIRAPHVTLVWAALGFIAAYCYAVGSYPLALLGAALMQAKNILDAVDGSLARLQNRPSRIGRFLDSISDAVIAAALYAALAVALSRERPIAVIAPLAAAALLLSLLQGSVYNYLYVRFRARRGGDTTSHVREQLTQEDRAHYRERPLALLTLQVLIWAYNLIYGWQDVVVQRIDGWAARPLVAIGRSGEADALRDDRQLLSAASALGPGLLILILDVYTVAGYRHLALVLELFLWTVAVGGTLYAAAIFVRLRRGAARLAREIELIA
jgi:phosphatidylglycerophosphate synthase